MDKHKFKHHVLNWAEKLGVSKRIREIHLRTMKRKIASCSSSGRLTFDPSIFNKGCKEIDYIIVHELLHLRYPNHGRMFKRLLKMHIKLNF